MTRAYTRATRTFAAGRDRSRLSGLFCFFGVSLLGGLVEGKYLEVDIRMTDGSEEAHARRRHGIRIRDRNRKFPLPRWIELVSVHPPFKNIFPGKPGAPGTPSYALPGTPFMTASHRSICASETGPSSSRKGCGPDSDSMRSSCRSRLVAEEPAGSWGWVR